MLKKKHDCIMVHILDPREFELPDVGYIELEDEETGEQVLVDTSDEEFRREYAKLAKNKIGAFSTMAKKLKVDLISLPSDEPFDVPLRQFFNMRIRRLAK